jgi:hypothetical protein
VVFRRGDPGYHLFTVKKFSCPNPFDSTAPYQISVQGRIDPSWSDRLEGMRIYPATDEADSQVTTLEGELCDQAALAGVLNTLYEMHLPIVSVLRMKI